MHVKGGQIVIHHEDGSDVVHIDAGLLGQTGGELGGVALIHAVG